MSEKMKTMPKNESELVELKNYISECEVNLSKTKTEVDCV